MEMLVMPPVYLQSGSELLSNLDRMKAIAALVKTCELQLMGRLDEIGTAQELGARDTVELVAQRYRIDPVEVRKDLAFAGALHKYPAVTAALPDPADPARPAVVSPDQAKVIVKTLEKAPATVPVETLTVAEEQMVEAARITNPRELTRFGHKVLSTLDTDGPEPAEDQARAKEFVRLRRTEDGVKISGFVAGAYAELLKTQLHTLSKPHKTVDGERDPRTADQRGADALKIILDRAAGNPDSPGVPHLTVTIDFEDLKATLAAAPAAFGGTTGADTNGVGATSGRGGVGELVFGGNLSAGAVRLLACDAAVLPIVLGGDSQPLDVGTEQRFVNRYIRRALNKRDKGCVVCKAPPWMCHAHHLIHWAAGGPTSLQNLALLCAFHHRAVHDGQWALSITADGVQVTRPSWADPPPITDPAALAEVIGWVTPAHTHNSSDDCDGSDRSAGVGSASAGWSGLGGVHSNPTHQQPERLPAASTLPNPGLAAAREALRTNLAALAPNYPDPWGTNTTPTAGP
ncbi:HNH endonuclease signature motif containing protein [Kribbella yunnanensis]